MKNINIGVANLIISNKLKESYFNNNLIEESRKVTTDFFYVVKNSPVLQLEFQAFNNLENKHIVNELLVKECIDKNIKVFEVYTLEEIQAERAKLVPFISEVSDPVQNDINKERVNLYEAISTLITESLKLGDDVDVNELHEAFTFVFNHIKTEKKVLTESVDAEPVNEDVLGIAVSKFNEKYADLNEGDRKLLQTLIKSSDSEKKTLLENMKTENLAILEGMNKGKLQDGIAKAIQKIKEMVYDQKNVEDNIIGLHELKKELL